MIDNSAPAFVEARDISCSFSIGREGFFTKKQTIDAVRGISFSIRERETFGLVGESGCGKSTTGKILLNLQAVTGGKVLFQGKDIHESKELQARLFKQAQLIFQDPFSALNPRMVVGNQLVDILDAHRFGDPDTRQGMVLDMFESVGLPQEAFHKLPHQLSGGQQQRVVIGRALIMSPMFVVCDEPVSSLDVSVQAQVINLLLKLQNEKNLTYLFISHDLKLIRFICDRVSVMYLGKLVEIADKRDLFARTAHPYTQALIDAAPIANPNLRRQRSIIKGEPPSLLSIPPGCSFHDRCPHAIERCTQEEPELRTISSGHWVACHLAERVAKQ
jgi:oligopeptide/dipeptide ABC transporter ATP-binding protein